MEGNTDICGKADKDRRALLDINKKLPQKSKFLRKFSAQSSPRLESTGVAGSIKTGNAAKEAIVN